MFFIVLGLNLIWAFINIPYSSQTDPIVFLARLLGGFSGVIAITLGVPIVLMLPTVRKPIYFRLVVIGFLILTLGAIYGTYYSMR